MAAPTAGVQIANLALTYVGQTPKINSINPPTPGDSTALLVSLHYDQCRQEVLREHPWHFATKFAYITRIGTPVSDWSDQYQLPADFIRFLSIEGQVEQWQETEYKILGNTVCVNNLIPNPFQPASGNATVLLRYIYDVSDISIWVSDAKKLFALKLASAIAYQITKQNDVVERLEKLIDKFRPSAYAVSGQENVPIRIETSRAINRRRFQLGGALVASPWTFTP
jgi:hypothetical protein